MMNEDMIQKYGKEYILAGEKSVKEGFFLGLLVALIIFIIYDVWAALLMFFVVFVVYTATIGAFRQYFAFRRKVFEDEDNKTCLHCGKKPFEHDDK